MNKSTKLSIKKAITFLILILSFTNTYGQNYDFETLDVRSGLPCSGSAFVFEDSRGFLWIGTTGGGLVRYDGEEMLTFTAQDGFSENVIYSINEDKYNNIWFTNRREVVKMSKDFKFKTYTLGEEEFIESMVFITKDDSIIATSLEATYIYSPQIDSFIPHFLMGKYSTKTILEDNKGYTWFGGNDGLWKYKDDNVIKMEIKGPNVDTDNLITSSLIDFNGNLWFGTKSGFVKYTNNNFKGFDQFVGRAHNYTDLLQLKDSSYIFSTYGGGIVKFKSPEKRERQFLSYATVDDVIYQLIQTKGGTVWLSSRMGAVKIKSKEFKVIELWDSLYFNFIPTWIKKGYDDNYWIATQNGLIQINFKKHTSEHILISKTNPRLNAISAIYVDHKDKSVYVGTKLNKAYKYKNNIFTPFAEENSSDLSGSTIIQQILKDSQGYFWLSKGGRALKCTDSTTVEIVVDSTIKAFITEIKEDFNKNIWFASFQGLYVKYHNSDNVECIKIIDGQKLQGLRHIEISKNNILWLSSRGYGLYRYDINAKKGEFFTTKNGLTSNFIQDLKLNSSESVLWCSTTKGMNEISLNSEGNIVKIKQHTNPESSHCNYTSLCTDSTDGVFTGVNGHVFNYKLNTIKKNTSKASIGLESIYIFNNKIDLIKYSTAVDNYNIPVNLVLPYNQNHLTFNYYAIELFQPESVNIMVKLEGFDKEWLVPTQDRAITYSYLPPNTYTLKIKAQNSDGLWSDTFEYTFTIKSPYYKTWWFITLCILSILGVIYYFVSRKIKLIKTKADIQKNIAELELKALRSQMNPHFIFNIMNNIQTFVISQNTTKAVNLLGDFAQLIRNILNISSDKTILLSKEVEFLTNYLDLDLSQYPNKYKYDFSFSDNIDQDNILLPPMLIQPFVENSILHGLMHRTENGELKISFTQTNQTIICEIEDNGVGREKAKQLANDTKQHKSVALNISNQRIEQFNTIHKTDAYSITIVDLKDSNNEAVGTKAILKLPLILKY